MFRMNTCGAWFIGIATAFWCNCALAQITPDATLPNNSIVNINGKTFNITGGTQAGTNLFHSFKDFSVPTGGEAFFYNTVDIQNIISRVTGRSVSNIDGLIRTLGTANLFLINPNGIIFGRNASLNIGGSFLASTASSLKFADGTEFRTDGTQTTPLLTISVPIGLQFGTNPGSIQYQSPSLDATSGLIVQPGKSLALVGGNVAIEAGKLEAAGGRIELGGLASAGTVGLVVDGNNLSLGFADNVTRADISLTNEATVSVEADGGGSITVNARNLDVSGGSRLSAGMRQGLGSVNSVAGDIRLNATERIKVVGSGVFNNVQSQSAYNGGNVVISAGSLSLTDGARLEANTFGSGDAGNVFVKASDSVSLANAAILSTVKSGAAGDAGNVVISAGSLSLTNGARLEANTFGSGNAGNVLVNASDFVSLKDSAQLSTSSFGLGSAGDLKIAARSILLENNADVKSEALGGGSGGNISLDQRILLLSRNSKVSVNAGGTGEVGVSNPSC